LTAVQNIFWLNKCKCNPFLHSHGNSKFILLTAICRLATIQRECIFAFPQQHWLCKCTKLCYTCIAYLVYYCLQFTLFSKNGNEKFGCEWWTECSGASYAYYL